MSWNYRLIEHDNGLVSLHEVYYDKAGEPNGCTAEPVGFSAEGSVEEDGETAVQELYCMLSDALKCCAKPVMKMSLFDAMHAEQMKMVDEAISPDSRPAIEVMKEYWSRLVQKKADEARERESVSRETLALDESTEED